MVRMGMVVRHPASDSAPRVRSERSCMVVCLAGGCNLHVAPVTVAEARRRAGAERGPNAVGGGRRDDSSLRAAAYRELAFLSALVRRARAMGIFRVWNPAAMDTLVLSGVDVALGQPAWRMALWYGAARNLCAG